MIYLTGDIHGGIDIAKLNNDLFIQQVQEGDYLIICGDFGLVWDYRGENERERDYLDYLESQPYTTLFIDGNHENFTRLNEDYPQMEWHGGYVHKIRDSIYHLMRGQVFTIEGQTFFTLGGATSIDKYVRIENKSWWKEELPSTKEYKESILRLMIEGNKVDYVITHCLPTSIQEEITDLKYEDQLTNFFDRLSKILKYKKWFAGHYHIDEEIYKFRVLYNEIISLDEQIIIKNK